ncbi:GDP-L-fucose synthase [Dokdonia pacifica]|uniref:GDP-L-fucose synthase n=1 Tax=Dokdonia pacifica TaxID=1627892 RepID=A0A238WFW4_9FLAO|nr:GDP-L-fucose synthase [Dokdonia pacifica]GGG20928.1 GDP-L-fucose synthase [Dokdonia pacifica]SNR45482.1 GDP-L-fucose synthase [Dokdonia pacifica]
MKKDAKIYIAGHRGLVGSAIKQDLEKKGYTNLIYKTHKELDLINTQEVATFFETEQPEYVFLAAAKVGGIIANNTYRADFIHANLMIQNNVIHQSYKSGVKKLLFLGSTCIYPKEAPQPMKENSLLTGPLEYTNEPYAIAKIAGIKMCESYNLQYGTNFLSVMPTNLYGYNDNFDLEKSHVLPALIRKMHLAKLLSEGKKEEVVKDLNVSAFAKAQETLKQYGVSDTSVEIWGTGAPRREFLWSQDMANACVFIMENTNFSDVKPSHGDVKNTHINIGTGEDISIKELAETIQKIVGFQGNLTFNTSKPDGTLRKLTDVSKLHALGWKHKIQLEEGIEKLYAWYLEKQ